MLLVLSYKLAVLCNTFIVICFLQYRAFWVSAQVSTLYIDCHENLYTLNWFLTQNIFLDIPIVYNSTEALNFPT